MAALSTFHGGTGQRVLLLHSGFCTWVEWRRTIDLLVDDHEVLAPTQPGSAGAPRLDVSATNMLGAHADHVERVLDDHGWDEHVLVVGSSYGAVTGMELLNRGRAAHLLALAPPWVAPPAGLAFYLALFSPLLGMRATRPLWPWSTRRRRLNSLFLHQSLTPLELDAEDMAALLGSMSAFPLIDVGRRTHVRGPGMPELATIPQDRVTLVWGTADWFVPRWMRQRWQAALPGSDVLELRGFPHQPHLRDPRRIAEMVSDSSRRAGELGPGPQR
jgi:pimeloyl-ACP methyl ester carboxylesterase